MIAAWAVYGIALTFLLALAARAAAEILDAWGLPTRWAWAAAAAGSVAVPAVLRWDLVGEMGRRLGGLLAVGAEGAAVGTGAGAPGALEALAAAPPSPSVGWPELLQFSPAADRVVLVVWAVGSGLVLAGALQAWWRVRRGRRSWLSRRIDGTEVLLSGETGPAVSGVLDPVIVVPRRILELPAEERRLVVAHERQHREAGDPALLAVGLAALAACPWNPALWWVVRRLRLAVERDCDRRVLEAGADPEAYGSVLLAEAGARGAPLPAAALGQGRSHLEQRIRSLTRGVPRFRTLRSAAAVIAAAGLLTLACDAPTPQDPATPSVDEAAAPAASGAEGPAEAEGASGDEGASGLPAPSGPGADDVRDRPRFVPRDVEPEPTNGREIRRMMVRRSASLEPGVRGTTRLWIYVDRTGQVAKVQFAESSGHEALDRAAMEVARRMEFEPARSGGDPVAVWVSREVTLAGATPAETPEGETSGAADGGEDLRRRAVRMLAPEGTATRADSLPLEAEDVASVEVDGRSGTARVHAKDGRIYRIRGNSRLDLSDTPIIFIDGERVRNGPGADGELRLNDLDPDDIESIEVIKGPAAARLYGEEARGGVIRISTKGGG